MFAPRPRNREFEDRAEEIKKLQKQIQDNQLEHEAEIEFLQEQNQRMLNENERLRELLRTNTIVQENLKLKSQIPSLKNKNKKNKLNQLLDKQEDKTMDLF